MALLGESAALLTAFLWSASSFIFTALSFKLGSVQLNLYRMLLACLFIFITISFTGINFNATNNQIILLSISGLVGLVIGDSFLFKSFSQIGPRVSMLVMSSNPGMAAVIAFFVLGETLAIEGIVGIIITLTGISIVILQKTSSDVSRFKITKKGILYAFIAALGQAVGLIFAKMAYTEADIDPFTATFIRLAASCIVLLPLAIAAKKLANPINLFKGDWKSIKLLTLGTIIGPYLGITLSFVAVVHAKVGIASTLMSTPPVIMLPMAYLLYKEKLSTKSIIGAIIAVLGVAILFVK